MRAMNTGSTDSVRVAFPADTVNMAIARTVAAAIAARADLTVDQVEDVRLAMDEATSHMIRAATPGATVTIDLWVSGSVVHAQLSCPVDSASPPEPDPFSWTVLTALVGAARLQVEAGTLSLHWELANDHPVRA